MIGGAAVGAENPMVLSANLWKIEGVNAMKEMGQKGTLPVFLALLGKNRFS
jgi:hypothetical protein